MKRALRIIVPFLLILAVLGCTAWYLFEYDRDFTRDLLLFQARHFESSGDHKTAAWLYDLAYAQSGEDDDVAIELARQYKSVGNYTKAEYTLANAIADGATAKLYKELCATYVEQDKLLDAVSMFNNILDPAIKAELEAARPKAPAITPDPGFHSQYITVEITAESGTLYVTTNGEYPSLEDAPSTGSISLGLGETVITALCVGEDKLVSPLAVYGYTVGGVIEAVTFADPAVEAAIRQQLQVSSNLTLYTNDLWTVTEFTMPADAATYEDLIHLPYLQTLTIENGLAGQLSHLTSLSALQSLDLTGCAPTEEELAAIAALPKLQSLTLANCGISSLMPLQDAKNLVYLDLTGNTVGNISFLSGMTKLQELYLGSNAVTDLSDLSGLTTLHRLDVSHNAVTTLTPVCHLISLTYLNAGSNSIHEIERMAALTALEEVDLSQNALTDVSSLAACTAIKRLDISNNTITDITALSALGDLEYFDFSHNQAAALPVFPADCPLVTVNGSYNLLTSVEQLMGLPQLNNVLMDYNAGITDLKPLDSCPLLIQVNVFGTQVSDVSFLTQKSVIVNFDPTL